MHGMCNVVLVGFGGRASPKTAEAELQPQNVAEAQAFDANDLTRFEHYVILTGKWSDQLEFV